MIASYTMHTKNTFIALLISLALQLPVLYICRIKTFPSLVTMVLLLSLIPWYICGWGDNINKWQTISCVYLVISLDTFIMKSESLEALVHVHNVHLFTYPLHTVNVKGYSDRLCWKGNLVSQRRDPYHARYRIFRETRSSWCLLIACSLSSVGLNLNNLYRLEI